MEEIREWRYKPKILVMAVCLLIAEGMTIFATWLALTNDRGLVIEHFIELSQESATIFYWCLTAVTAAGTILGLVAFISFLVVERYVRLTSREISAPKSAFSRKNTVVPFEDITDMKIKTIQKQQFVTICYKGGKLNIARSLMPSRGDFEELCRLLAGKVGDSAQQTWIASSPGGSQWDSN